MSRTFMPTSVFDLYKNLLDKINCICDIFVEDTSLFSSVHDESSHRNKLKNDFHKINKWTSKEK